MAKLRFIDILGYIGLGIVIIVFIYLLLKMVGIVESPTEQLLTALVAGLILHAFKIEGDLGRIKAKLKI